MVLDAFILQHIQLCDWNTAGSVQCNPYYGGCAGASLGTSWPNHCYPNHVWSGSAQSSGVYWVPNLNGRSIILYGACNTGYCPVSFAFSVRCMRI